MIINIKNLKEAKEFRDFIHKVNKKGIDSICDIIEKSINHQEMSNGFIINTKNYEDKK